MKITVVGSGYVGLVTGACFADLGNDVTCVDIDENKVKILMKGEVPFYEPSLSDLLKRGIRTKRLTFTTDIKKGVEEGEVIFICVGTPEDKDGKADLQYVWQVAKDIGTHMNGFKVIVDKSTVPVGTSEKVARIIKENLQGDHDFAVLSNPEFLREGAAVKDFQNPDRVVIGTENQKAKDIMEKLYRPVARMNRPIMFTTPQTAEMIKYASNAMLATRISFMNELANLCEKVGADVKEVAVGMGLDNRIGPRFLQAGCGYGGSCFPKDVQALGYTMEQHGSTSNLLRAVEYINERQKKSLVPKLKQFIPKLDGKKIAIWGLSFKPRTSDMREAPAITVTHQLQDEYAEVVAYDPEAMEEAKHILKNVKYVSNPYEALEGADALIVCTEWDEFREPDFDKMKALLNEPIVIDGRNVFQPERMRELGFNYVGVGR